METVFALIPPQQQRNAPAIINAIHRASFQFVTCHSHLCAVVCNCKRTTPKFLSVNFGNPQLASFTNQRGKAVKPIANSKHLILLIVCRCLVPKPGMRLPRANRIVVMSRELNLSVGGIFSDNVQVISRRRYTFTDAVFYACFWIVFIHPPIVGFHHPIESGFRLYRPHLV